MMKVITCLLLVAAASLVVAAAAGETPAISCGKVTSTLAPCFMYVMNGGTVPENCCAAVKSLNNEAITTAARRNVCLCLKSVTKTASAAAVKNAKSLPGKCGIFLPYEISPAIDCNK